MGDPAITLHLKRPIGHRVDDIFLWRIALCRAVWGIPGDRAWPATPTNIRRREASPGQGAARAGRERILRRHRVRRGIRIRDPRTHSRNPEKS